MCRSDFSQKNRDLYFNLVDFFQFLRGPSSSDENFTFDEKLFCKLIIYYGVYFITAQKYRNRGSGPYIHQQKCQSKVCLFAFLQFKMFPLDHCEVVLFLWQKSFVSMATNYLYSKIDMGVNWMGMISKTNLVK